MPGIYDYVHKGSDCTGQLDIGCSRDSEIVVDGRCPGGESADVLQCYANWTENDRVFLIAGRAGDLRKAADCLVYKVTAKGYELEADPSCGSERVNVMGRPIDFIVKSPSKPCTMSTTKSATIYPAQSQESRDETGIYDTQQPGKKSGPSSEVIETPPRNKNPNGVIGRRSGVTMCSLAFLSLSFVMATTMTLTR
ncbi:uncharacterized protein LOC101853387 [Aplysia californica]|uniref:Uncharacterized protein LOC101853387 n=1 Tax=Aplysia californica TaxID=6500 RepID=A0ABM1A012_APLCA|nr:uncharacterized protein LOC101853387 [Aplysia californica]